jgi:hypothetical protein
VQVESGKNVAFVNEHVLNIDVGEDFRHPAQDAHAVLSILGSSSGPRKVASSARRDRRVVKSFAFQARKYASATYPALRVLTFCPEFVISAALDNGTLPVFAEGLWTRSRQAAPSWRPP